MPYLNWVGKEKIVNHHKEVPYCVLDRKYSYDSEGEHPEDNGSENMIIHGDNLYALKSLLPKYEGKIKCIYIDPPYNTGNKDWCYNDNVDHPIFKKWLEETLNQKESERYVHVDDLSRHDKWLCMMYPRLKLLKQLLSDTGVIFISIDDNELFNLKMICDEIFGLNNYVSTISWQRTYAPRNDSKGISSEVEYILVYTGGDWSPNELPRTEQMNAKYKNIDNDYSSWRPDNAFAADASTHQGMVYAIQHPFTGDLIYPSNGLHWRYNQDEMLRIMSGWCPYILKDLDDAKERAKVCGISVESVKQGVKALMLEKSIEESNKMATLVYKRGQWPKYYFSKGGYGGIAKKTYLCDVKGRLPTNLWSFSDVGHTDEAKKEIMSIFGTATAFSTPKPTRLIKQILAIATDKDSIVLDSFAGSNTTAHAVLSLNNEDGGSRTFISIETLEYAESVTSERIKHIIKGDNEHESIPGSFSFYELGEPLLVNGFLNNSVDSESIKQYIFYSETRLPYVINDERSSFYLGQTNGCAYYFYYDGINETILNEDSFSKMKVESEHHVVYADVCTLSKDQLRSLRITFKKIPREIIQV